MTYGELLQSLYPNMYTSSSGWSIRTNPITGKSEFHSGIDYAAVEGTPIPAAADGKVWSSAYNDAYGYYVIIQNTTSWGTFYTLYAHQTGEQMPEVGKEVKAGEAIGQVGSTGLSTGNHLHFEVIYTPPGVEPIQQNNSCGPLGLLPGLFRYVNPDVFLDMLSLDSPSVPNIDISDDPSISDSLSRYFTRATQWRPSRDPLSLDLDGDGIETVGINTNNPILFDHNADGVKTATGWIKGDDGLLVLDRNNNGTIDNGRELFGDSTVMSNGQTAADGFAALADLDSNRRIKGQVFNLDIRIFL